MFQYDCVVFQKGLRALGRVSKPLRALNDLLQHLKEQSGVDFRVRSEEEFLRLNGMAEVVTRVIQERHALTVTMAPTRGGPSEFVLLAPIQIAGWWIRKEYTTSTTLRRLLSNFCVLCMGHSWFDMRKNPGDCNLIVSSSDSSSRVIMKIIISATFKSVAAITPDSGWSNYSGVTSQSHW